MRRGLKPFPARGFAEGATAAGWASLEGSAGEARRTVTVLSSPSQPVALPSASAATPPRRAQATATAAKGPERTALELYPRVFTTKRPRAPAARLTSAER